MEGIPDLEPLEHSVLGMALDSGLMEGVSKLEPLEHSVLNVDLDIAEVHDEPMFGSDSRRTFMKFTDAMWKEALRLGADFNWSMSEEEELINSDDEPVVDFDSEHLGRRVCFGLSGCSG